jgi:hypothetical protein
MFKLRARLQQAASAWLSILPIRSNYSNSLLSHVVSCRSLALRWSLPALSASTRGRVATTLVTATSERVSVTKQRRIAQRDKSRCDSSELPTFHISPRIAYSRHISSCHISSLYLASSGRISSQIALTLIPPHLSSSLASSRHLISSHLLHNSSFLPLNLSQPLLTRSQPVSTHSQPLSTSGLAVRRRDEASRHGTQQKSRAERGSAPGIRGL